MFDLFLEVTNLLLRFAREGDLENMKQLFQCINQEDQNEIGAKSNEAYRTKNSTLVNIHSSSVSRTPLMEAIMKGHILVAKYLIVQQNASVDARDFNQDTALIQAARNDNIEAVKLLLDHNVNIKAQNKYRGHAAYYAALNGNKEILRLLIEKDEEVINLKGSFGCTPLIAASEEGRVDVCKYLIGRKADINIQDDKGETAIQLASNNNHIDIVDFLKQNGAKDSEDINLH